MVCLGVFGFSMGLRWVSRPDSLGIEVKRTVVAAKT